MTPGMATAPQPVDPDPGPAPADVAPAPLDAGAFPAPHVLSALPDFVLGASFLAAWIAPDQLPVTALRWLFLAVLMEFIIIHSSAFAGQVIVSGDARGRKVLRLIGLGLFYTLFAAGFALAFQSAGPLVAFWSLMLNRMTGVLFGQAPAGEEKSLIQRGWAGGVVCYLFACGASVVVPWPALGITDEVKARLALPSSGLWVEQPWRVYAAGFLYFTGIALLELDSFRWFRNWSIDGKRIG